jgi:hypothetical protein
MRAPPHVIYAQAKYMWAQGERESSLNFLRQFATSLSSDVKTEPSRTGVPRPKYDEISRLLARCYFKQGQWEAELDSEWQSVSGLCVPHFRVSSHIHCSEILLRSYTSTSSLPTSTLRGTKRGTHGLWLTSKSSVSWKPKRRTRLRTFLETSWLLTSCKL